MTKPNLPPRLQMVAGAIPVCRTLVDIGTDHALIPIYAAQTGLCQTAIAGDVNPGPLEIAKTAIIAHGLGDKIASVLSNGLENIPKTALSSDCALVIAGMGGDTIAGILQNHNTAAAILLQPMTAVEKLYKFLYDDGFEITAETLAAEGEKLYHLICARQTGVKTDPEPADLLIGKQLLRSGSPLLGRYILRKISKLQKRLDGLTVAGTFDNEFEQTKEQINLLKTALEGSKTS